MNVKCLDLVKMYGKRPRKLLNKINENKEINIKDLPKFFFLGKSVLNSLCNLFNNKFHRTNLRLGISQNESGKTVKPSMVLIQFNDKLKILHVGSNDEKRFVIIFSY